MSLGPWLCPSSLCDSEPALGLPDMPGQSLTDLSWVEALGWSGGTAHASLEQTWGQILESQVCPLGQEQNADPSRLP